VYESIDDVYNEILDLYNISNEQGFDIGHSLYSQCAFFTGYELLVMPKYQDRIKEYQFCKNFSCPPYPNLQETPVRVIEDFFIIENELHCCMKKEQKDKSDG
jgi:hypothetical protein